MTYTLTISDGDQNVTSTHGNLRDARSALTRYTSRRGLHFTINPWRKVPRAFLSDAGARRWDAVQDGVLRTGMQVIGTWVISHPLGQEMTA